MDLLTTTLALATAPRMTPEQVCTLIDQHAVGAPIAALLEKAHVTVGPDWQRRYDEAARALERGAAQGVVALRRGEPRYPRCLRELTDAPAVLFVEGDLAALQRPGIAVVGSRAASEIALRSAARVAQRVVESGAAVVSGLALGVDTAAHEACVAVRGVGIAVLAHGHQTVSPAKSRTLGRQLLDAGGALVSEYAWGTPVQKRRFVERDRIQAALSRAVIVVETTVDGGTMHTARAAQRYGRLLAALGNGPTAAGDGNRALIAAGADALTTREELEAFIRCAHARGEG